MKKEKEIREATEGIDLSIRKVSEYFEKKYKKYLGILEAVTLKQLEMK